MAGDWIKWCKGFGRKPEVVRMADRLQLHRHQIAAAYMELAEWLDSEGVPDDEDDPDSDITVTLLSRSERDRRAQLVSHVDDISRTLGLAIALEEVGWIEIGEGWIRFKRAARHNSETSKKRALASRRQQKRRAQKTSRNGAEIVSRKKRDQRREEKSINNPLPLFRFEDLAERWNATPGTRRALGITEKRRKLLSTRWKEEGFRQRWEEAIAKFPLRCFAEADGWLPDIDWFLRPGKVLEILEGKFDWAKQDGAGSREPPPAGQDPNRKYVGANS